MSSAAEHGPAGSPYDWYQRAMSLLASGNPDAAIQLLQRLREDDPTSRSVLEAYARASFDGRHLEQAADAFAELLERAPDDDYAHYGLGLCRWRQQRFIAARDHLAMAFVMRPDRSEYGQALAQVRATLRAREADGLPLEGPLGPFGAMDGLRIEERERSEPSDEMDRADDRDPGERP